jgi:hypothetical protein
VPDIAMWGAPGSGKTTFLYALDIALNRKQFGFTMTADDDPSEMLLINSGGMLAGGREFPTATLGIEHFQWSLYGRRRQTVSTGGIAQVVDQQQKIILKLADPSGELALRANLGDANRKKLITTLADADGIIFMFDPIREAEKGDAFETTSGLLHQLTRQVAQADPDNFDGKLPHHVAICVTKFDEPKVLETAESLRLLRYERDDLYQFPRVDDSDARRLLTSLCSVSSSGNSDLMLNSLDQHFYADRVKFFVTSAVGFYVNPSTNKFDRDDPQNLVKDTAGFTRSTNSRIRGPIHPINIVEPVLWLGGQKSRR